MRNRKLQKVLSSLLIVSLLIGAFASLALAADEPGEAASPAAPALLESANVAGTLTGGQFAKVWLSFTPIDPSGDVTIVAEWDRDNPADNGLDFFVLNPSQLATVVAGGSLSDNNVGSGDPVFQGAANLQQVTFNAFNNTYTVVVINDSATDANFTLSATNGLFGDDSGQVRDPNAATPEGAETPAADAAATPAATTATTATAVTTVTTVTTATTETVAAAATPAATPAAATVATTVAVTTSVVRAAEVKGSLPSQNDQHFLGLVPETRDAEITLTLTFDPQDSSELSRRLNFWVLNDAGFQSFVGGTPASEVAIAAGNRTFEGQSNERVAIFNVTGTGAYTVIVYNNSQVPATYTLRVAGGLLVDDSGQTDTAKALGAGAVVTGTVASTATAAPATAAPAAAATTTTTGTVATAAREGEPGGTYTVVAGDTIALIARDIYGDYTLYTAICTFNNKTDCNSIEIGDVIKLPTLEQIAANATAPAAATPVAAATTAAAAATPAATSAVTPTTAAPAATATTAATTTTTAGGTAATLPTATPAASATTPAATGNTIVDLAEANGNFTILIQALEATGLDEELSGDGPFTVFAPTDTAFNALGQATVAALLRDTAQLEQILRFHVVSGEILSDDLSNGLEATTLQGSPVEFTLTGATAKVQDSNIVSPDTEASNGVIHIIDKVMLPPAP